MADIIPSVIANAIMGKLYDVLTNGDATVPKATDSFFSWCTPGIPVDAEDFRFLSQGLTGVVTAKAAASLAAVTAPPSGGEEIAAFISQVMHRDMSMLKQQYQQDLVNATLTGTSSGSDFLYTALVPGDFVQSAGWSTFWFNIGDFSRYANSSFSNSGWQAQAGASFLGLFGGGGSASGSQSRVQSNIGFDSSNFSLRFSICQIPIVRSWFKDAYLLSKCWRFDQTNPDYKNLLVSDGGKPPKGYMPAYPTSVVFIKDLYLTINKSSGAASFVQQQQSSSAGGGGVVSIGPFCLGGSASHYSNSGYSQRDVHYQWDDQGLSVPGMQIAGFKCHVVASKCPAPDSSITSWV